MTHNRLLAGADAELNVIDGWRAIAYPTKADWNAQYSAMKSLEAKGPDLARLAIDLHAQFQREREARERVEALALSAASYLGAALFELRDIRPANHIERVEREIGAALAKLTEAGEARP